MNKYLLKPVWLSTEITDTRDGLRQFDVTNGNTEIAAADSQLYPQLQMTSEYHSGSLLTYIYLP